MYKPYKPFSTGQGTESVFSVQLLSSFSEYSFPSNAFMAKSTGLLGICLFLFAVLPLIISSSYSKVHRLYVLAGDTEIEMNICWRSTLVERSGRGENWTRKETELQYRPLKPCASSPSWGEAGVRTAYQHWPMLDQKVKYAYGCPIQSPVRAANTIEQPPVGLLSLPWRQTLKQTEGVNSWRLSFDHSPNSWDQSSFEGKSGCFSPPIYHTNLCLTLSTYLKNIYTNTFQVSFLYSQLKYKLHTAGSEFHISIAAILALYTGLSK